jgi:hypothetical protein
MRERILQIIYHFHGRKRGNKALFCNMLDIKSGLLNDWLSKKKTATPKENYRNLICKTYGVSRTWLDSGIGPMLAPVAGLGAQEAGDLPSGKASEGGDSEARKTLLNAPVGSPPTTERELRIDAQAESRTWKTAHKQVVEATAAAIDRSTKTMERVEARLVRDGITQEEKDQEAGELKGLIPKTGATPDNTTGGGSGTGGKQQGRA